MPGVDSRSLLADGTQSTMTGEESGSIVNTTRTLTSSESNGREGELWMHPMHLGPAWLSHGSSDCSQARSTIAPPEALMLHEVGMQAKNMDGMPASCRLAAGSAMLAAEMLQGSQANSSLVAALSNMRQVRVTLETEGGYLCVSWGGTEYDPGWAVEVPLLGSEVAHFPLNPDVGGFVIAVVPRVVKSQSLKDGRGRDLPPSAADVDLNVDVDPADIGTWLFVLDGDDSSLLQSLNSISVYGAIRTNLSQCCQMTQRALGSGGCATVYVGRSIATGELTAVKVSREPGSKADRSLPHEVALAVASQGHAHIIRFLGLFRTQNPLTDSTALQWAVVLELCSGGDLQQRIAAQGPQAERDVGPILRGALRGISHIHERGIVHRDVKSENILLKDGLFPVLTDFGVAAFAKDAQAMSCRCGSAGYVAPEVLRAEKPYDCKVDVFGIGVTMYFMLTARLPFAGKDVAQVLRRNMRCQIDLDRDFHMQQSGLGAKTFLRALMQALPEDRLSAEQAVEHDWFTLRQDSCQSSSSTGSSPAQKHSVPVPPPFKPPPDQRPPPRRGIVGTKTLPAQASEQASAARLEPRTLAASQGHPRGGNLALVEAAAAAVAAASANAAAPERGGRRSKPTATTPAVSRPMDDDDFKSRPYQSEGDEDSPQERKSLRPTICKRLHSALAAGMASSGMPGWGASRAPNFEMHMERLSNEPSRQHRKFRLVGEREQGQQERTSHERISHIRFGMRRENRLLTGRSMHSMQSDEDDDDDGRITGGEQTQTWRSFGRGSDASGLDTPRTTYTGSQTLRMSDQNTPRSSYKGSFRDRRAGTAGRSGTGGLDDTGRVSHERSSHDSATSSGSNFGGTILGWGSGLTKSRLQAAQSNGSAELADAGACGASSKATRVLAPLRGKRSLPQESPDDIFQQERLSFNAPSNLHHSEGGLFDDDDDPLLPSLGSGGATLWKSETVPEGDKEGARRHHLSKLNKHPAEGAGCGSASSASSSRMAPISPFSPLSPVMPTSFQTGSRDAPTTLKVLAGGSASSASASVTSPTATPSSKKSQRSRGMVVTLPISPLQSKEAVRSELRAKTGPSAGSASEPSYLQADTGLDRQNSGGSATSHLPTQGTPLPPTQVASTARGRAVSAATACAEVSPFPARAQLLAVQSVDRRENPSSSSGADAGARAKLARGVFGPENNERLSFGRSLRGRLGSLVTKKRSSATD
mmetsp:Transcript_164934/g.529405  ORF Transcript_164934/g.529405 Transcript_164934/m.529405 type:complete len:1212 (-) Transcript_164934:77-3712(-)